MSSLLRRQQIRSFVKANVGQIAVAWNAKGTPTYYRWPLLAPAGSLPKLRPQPRKKPRPKARWNGKRFVQKAGTRRPTFAVPAEPVQSTRADRAVGHRAKMLRKGH